MALEKKITNQIIKELNKDPSIWVRKRLTTGMSGTLGWPDITGIKETEINGQSFGIRIEIEVKRPGKKPSDIQYSRLRGFRRLGAIAFWTDEIYDCLKQFEHFGKTSPKVPYSESDLLPSKTPTIVQDL
jgi:hypothetical protein